MSSVSSPHRVRFASPELLHEQPSLKTTQHTPLKSGREATPPIYSHTPPPVLEDDKTAAYEPTPPAHEQSPLPPPKVKMSLKDFALRKKKQREEMAKERECESPGGLSMGLLEESGDEGIHVDDDGADERLGRDSEGTDHERDLEGVKDEPDTSFTMQNVVDCVLEDSPAESQRRCESEPRGATPYPPRSPVVSLRSVRSMDNAHPNGQLADPTSLVAKVEISETSIPNGLVGAYDRTSPSAPDPPPPPLHQQIKGTEKHSSSPKTFSSPLPPSAPASYSLRPSHEDGEITSVSPPKSSHFFPRSYTPPTQPRSFQTSHPLSPNFTHTTSTPTPSASWRGPPPPTRAPLSNTPSSNGPPRPLPSGPRALRVSQSSHPPTYSSPSSRVYSGSQYIPRGPSADRDRHDRDRLDWERERGWAPRPRGRTGSSGWGR
ncbi:uncharacterized protein HD556DRAFT_1241239 [Suillus plorans]|uniref:Uncharacterized protein n=1 Tax=Suillus plorans TaxID=116603 RepID=A0A9P7AK71_9AGAM|nr:uncharacterized protein HD556DRAFT_1241239 [Suillus plorans]KAG1791100.1 hypothetical protein HD556DRAFT_1241239 [Suillus plorans]